MKSQQIMNDDSGFVDVAANALAVVILVTMIALLISAVPLRRGEVVNETTPPLGFPAALDPTTPPLNAYWFVTEAGLTRVDLSAVALGIAQGEKKVVTNLGSFYFQNDRTSYRDLDEYRLDILPSPEGIAAAAQPLSVETFPTWIAQFEAEFEGERIVPTFFVNADAFSTFASFYEAMRETDVAMRWRFVRDDGKASVNRSSSNFESSLSTWR